MYNDEIWNGRKAFYLSEIEDFLGDYSSDYDIEAIVDAVSEIDYETGNRFWKDLTEDEFWEICEAHAFVG